MTKWQNFVKGIIKENPTLVLVLGTCPTLAVTTSVQNALGMGVAASAVLLCSNIAISALRKIIPDKVRIPAYIVLIAGFVTIIEMLMHAFVPDLYESLGLYLPLIVVNCIILGRAESFASKNGVLWSAADGLFMGIGFTLALTLMGLVREFLGYGSIFNLQVWNFQIGFFASSAGAFFTYAVFIAVFSLITAVISKKRKQKASKLNTAEGDK